MSELLRIRFQANLEDSRPVNYPVEYPWWCTGYSEEYSIVVSYADSEAYILKNWPEARNLDITKVDKIVFTDRFPKLNWDSKTIHY